MDGISVAASIVGLLSAAAKISLLLNDFINRVKEAPKLVRSVLTEVADISACLSQVQSLLLGTQKVHASNQSLLMVEEIVVVLSNCVLIFSELEELVEGINMKSDQSLGVSETLRWTMKEETINALLLRLQSSKTSLNLMVSTLTCSSIRDAQESVSQLTDVVQQLVESNRRFSEILGGMKSDLGDRASTIFQTARSSMPEESIQDDESIVTVRQAKATLPALNANEIKLSGSRSEFERLLESSRPYMRASQRPERRASAASSAVQTIGWSCLSGISLAQVSNIAVFELALGNEYVWNLKHYETRPGHLSTLASRTIVTKGTSINGRGSLYESLVEESNAPRTCEHCCEGMDSICSVAYSRRNRWWHIGCVWCVVCCSTSINTLDFFEDRVLVCQYCLPTCFICGSRSLLYPIHEGQKAFCLDCIERDVPCGICGAEIWERTRDGYVKGTSCAHYRNRLIQRAPHMAGFFYPATQPSSQLS